MTPATYVVTHWNSTYDMLEVAIKYHEALKLITGNQRMSWQRRIGKLQLSSATFSRYVIIPYHLIIDHAGFNRSSRMPPCSSCMIPPTSPLWYQLCITLMITSQTQYSIQSTLCQLKLLSLLERRPSTGTTTKQTILKSFVLWWVWFSVSFCLCLLLTSYLSPTFKTQASILWASWMGGCLGWEGQRTCTYWVWMVI